MSSPQEARLAPGNSLGILPNVPRAVLSAVVAAMLASSSLVAWAAWPSDPSNSLVVAIAPGPRGGSVATGDGSGGTFIAWIDTRAQGDGFFTFDTTRVYLQHLDAGGDIVPGFISNGQPVTPNPVDQGYPQVVSDRQGGVILVWFHPGGGKPGAGIYAQRFDASGTALWPSLGVVVDSTANGPNEGPFSAVEDGAGGVLVAWENGRNLGASGQDIYAQRLDSLGTRKWAAGGIPVCDASDVQFLSRMVADGSGGAVIAWLDARSGVQTEVYSQRVSREGVPQWQSRGVRVASDRINSLEVASDGLSGAFCLSEAGATQRLMVDHVRADGTADPAWLPGGFPLDAAHHYPAPGVAPDKLCSDGAGGAIGAWSSPDGIYAQRISPGGMGLWTLGGVRVAPSNANNLFGLELADARGGALFFFLTSDGTDVFLRGSRFDPAGAPLWPDTSGVLIAQTSADIVLNSGVPDGNGGAVITWTSDFVQTIRAQYIQANGTLGGNVVDAEASLIAASADADQAEISWYVPAARDRLISLERDAGTGNWTKLPSLVADGDDRVAFVDRSVVAGARYGYRISWASAHGPIVSEPVWLDIPRDARLSLTTPSPNPSVAGAQVRFSLPDRQTARLRLYDLAGREVREIANGEFATGEHVIAWDGCAHSGEKLSAGVYLLRLDSRSGHRDTKLVIAR